MCFRGNAALPRESPRVRGQEPSGADGGIARYVGGYPRVPGRYPRVPPEVPTGTPVAREHEAWRGSR